MEWDIGSEAREIDSRSLKERLKLEKTSIKKIFFAFIFYFVMIVILIYTI